MNSNLTTMVQVTKFDVVNCLLWMIKTNINKQAIFLQTAGKNASTVTLLNILHASGLTKNFPSLAGA